MENLKINKKAKIGKYVLKSGALTLSVATALLLLGCSASEAEIEITPTATIAATATPKPTPKITPTPSPTSYTEPSSTPYTEEEMIEYITNLQYSDYVKHIGLLNKEPKYSIEDFENVTRITREYEMRYPEAKVNSDREFYNFMKAMDEMSKTLYKTKGIIWFMRSSNYYLGEGHQEEYKIISKCEDLYEADSKESLKEYARNACKYFYDDTEKQYTLNNPAFAIVFGFSFESRLNLYNKVDGELITISYSEFWPFSKETLPPNIEANYPVTTMDLESKKDGIIYGLVEGGLRILESSYAINQVGEVKR